MPYSLNSIMSRQKCYSKECDNLINVFKLISVPQKMEVCFIDLVHNILDAFSDRLHDITVLETEVATFECTLLDESLEGERVWWYQGKKLEKSRDK